MKHIKRFGYVSNVDIDSIIENIRSILLDVSDSNLSENQDIKYNVGKYPSTTHAYYDIVITFSPVGYEFELTDTLYECLKTIELLLEQNGYAFTYNYDYRYYDIEDDGESYGSDDSIESIKNSGNICIYFTNLILMTYK